MTGRYHLSITLPGGERVTADFREPIVAAMQQAPEPSAVAAIVRWAEDNRQQIQACQEGRCDHFV